MRICPINNIKSPMLPIPTARNPIKHINISGRALNPDNIDERTDSKTVSITCSFDYLVLRGAYV
jgi:hypothetical protein